jgi:uncharacterized protein
MMSRFASADRSGHGTPGLRARAFALAAALVPVLAIWLAQPVAAQTSAPAHRSYINPFPNGDRYRIVVLGDSMGEGLWGGLYRAFEDDPTLEFIQRANGSTGLARPDRYDWDAELGKILKDENYQIAVVMFGGDDMQPIREGKNVFKVGTEEWRQAYGKRVEKFIRKLREANVAVYWTGLPIMRSPGQSSDAEQLNDVFREKAFVNGAKYVDTSDGFADEAGRYSAYGPDMSGQVKRLRGDDGVHLTMRGNVKLANFIEKELRKDLTQAKSERNIPLAGNEDEQAKITNRFATVKPAPQQPAESANTEEANNADDANNADEAKADEEVAEGDGTQDGELHQSQVGDFSVVRPALAPAAVQAPSGLASQPINVSTTEPEVIKSDLPDGFTAVATISAVADLSLASSRPRLPLSQRPYYKVLIRGEQLEPKSGRADDFAWPPG